MQFSILIPATVEIPAREVVALVEQVRKERGKRPNEAVDIEDVLNAASTAGYAIPEKFVADPDEALVVTRDMINEAIDDESSDS